MMIIAIGLIEPYKEKAKWWKELANEQVILATLYFAMCFSDLIPSAATQSLVGYAFCGMLAAHIGLYLLMISVTTIRTTLKNYKLNKFIAQRKKEWNARWRPLRLIKARLRIRKFVQKQRAAFEESEAKMIHELAHEQFEPELRDI